MDHEDLDYLESISDSEEGQLSVDVHETADEIIVRSTIAGVSVDDFDITVTPNTLTIRGEREQDCDYWSQGTTHVEECYWGKFSRSIVLPADVVPDAADAVLKNGVLTITLEKAEVSNQLHVLDLDE